MATLEVDVPPYVVWRSRAPFPNTYTAPTASDSGTIPDYSPFKLEKRLEVVDILKASSVVGPSQAILRLAAGPPISPEIFPENSDGDVLGRGDRVAIGLAERGGIRWLFAGYVTTAALLIDGRGESMTWRVYGPEWGWGVGGSNVGGFRAVFGQWRRIASADDAYVDDGTATSTFESLGRYSDLRTIFNPEGRANMTSEDVVLTRGSANPLKGRVWEEPDRLHFDGVTPLALKWNALDAARALVTLYNDPAATSIEPPSDWEAPEIPFNSGDILRETDVDGLCLYDALKKILGSRFAFYIDPNPGRISGNKWGPFKLKFFSRSRATAAQDAVFELNRPGTPMEKASASVKRLEAARDITKAVNRVVVGGKIVRHVRLTFWGGAKPAAPSLPYAIRPGWDKSDADLDKYSTDSTNDPEGLHAVNEISTTRGAPSPPPPPAPPAPPAPPTDWRDRFTTTGSKHADSAHVFRYFVWNESGEFAPHEDVQYSRDKTEERGLPDLSQVAVPKYGEDVGGEEIHTYSRRRRPLLDSIYFPTGSPDDWVREKASLYIAVAPKADDANFSSWTWHKVPESAWQPDKERAAFNITVADVAAWRPLIAHDKAATGTGGAATPGDPRTFATLLNQGLLRLCFEGSIELDVAMVRAAMPDTANGSPALRETFVRAGAAFVKTLKSDDGLPSPSGKTVAAVDNGDDAKTYAETLRDAGQSQRINASLSAEADWPEQPIGSFIPEIKGGRRINLSSGDRGAQIVSVKLDIRNNVWEYLTESAAMALAERDRRRLASGTKVYAGTKDEEEERHGERVRRREG
jgi:hypothetical protein